jgi:hypothetical protein
MFVTAQNAASLRIIAVFFAAAKTKIAPGVGSMRAAN